MNSFSRLIQLPHNQSIFLFGPRQVGKSTLLKVNFPQENTMFIDLLLAENYHRYIKNPSLLKDEVLARNKCFTHIVIDEVQRVPDLLNLVHYLIENDESKPKFILSGSSARKLKRGQANLLAGRALSYSLYPLNFLEIGHLFNLKQALNFGTLPAIYTEEDSLIRQEKLKAYAKTYLREVIKEEAIIRNLSVFINLVDFVAS